MDCDRGLYERLILPIEDQMIRCVWRVVRNAADAEDAFQDALVTILKRIDRIESHPNPQAVILRVCINAAWDALRRSITRRRNETARSVSLDSADPGPDAAQVLVARERQDAVLRAISRLPRRQAEAVLMRLVLDLSYGDIARTMGCDETTVRTHCTRGRACLSRELARYLDTKSREATS